MWGARGDIDDGFVLTEGSVGFIVIICRQLKIDTSPRWHGAFVSRLIKKLVWRSRL